MFAHIILFNNIRTTQQNFNSHEPTNNKHLIIHIFFHFLHYLHCYAFFCFLRKKTVIAIDFQEIIFVSVEKLLITSEKQNKNCRIHGAYEMYKQNETKNWIIIDRMNLKLSQHLLNECVLNGCWCVCDSLLFFVLLFIWLVCVCVDFYASHSYFIIGSAVIYLFCLLLVSIPLFLYHFSIILFCFDFFFVFKRIECCRLVNDKSVNAIRSQIVCTLKRWNAKKKEKMRANKVD